MATKTLAQPFDSILEGHIEITAGVAGGKPRITRRRITVQDIVIWHERMELSADEITTEYDLTLSDVYAALTYYYDHCIEIDDAIRESDTFVELFRRQHPSKLAQKLHQG